MLNRSKKFISVMLMFVILSSIILGSLGGIAPAHAQQATVSTIVKDIPRKIEGILTKVEKSVKAAMINAGTRAVTYALQKVAYDSAVWLASGGKGQGPLFITDNPGKYLGDVMNEAAGTAIEELGKPYGLNLCKVPNIKIDLAIRLGLRINAMGPPKKPECTGLQFAKNWRDGISKFGQSGGIISGFSASLKVDDSDFGIYTQASQRIGDMVLTQQYSKQLEQQIGQGFIPVTELISGETKVPAASVKEFADSQTPDKTIERNKDQVDAALSANDVKIWPSVVSIFLNTLASNLVKNFFEKGMAPSGGKIGGKFNKPLVDALDFTNSGISVLGKTTAQTFFSYLTAVRIKEAPSYDLLSELNSCPELPGIYNCRLGDDMLAAISQGITIGDAIKRGILDGSKRLIPPSNSAKSNSLDCYKDAYCLNNVKILRQVRILPLGFELAVQKSPATLWTLKQVVDGFNDCPANSSAPDDKHPYCKLIDPNWVLKSPETKCAAMVSGPNVLSSDTPERLQECANLQTCVGYSASGNCSKYAYCTREENTWKFAAENCESHFATCRSFENTDGETVSYLYRTLDTGACNANNAGCTAYSLKVENGSWATPNFDVSSGVNKGIYFNSKIENSCSANSAGCSVFKIASASNEDPLYLKKAPDYLKCYDTKPTTTPVDWPTTPAELKNLSTSPECSKYASACISEEASCNWYTPDLGGGQRLPARFTPAVIQNNTVTWNDQCDAKCVGYDVYREMPSNFSNGEEMAYIIPSSGQTCSAIDVGCSSFTNLSTATGGVENTEYYSSLRPCEKPSDTIKGKTFITYEGSKESGFQLKTFVLLPDSSGGPQYFYKDPSELVSMQGECTEARYQSGAASLDCRQFNDENGTIYYRLLSRTIPVDAACTPYRINNPEFFVDTAVASANACSLKQGFWDDGVCKMCLQNGKFQNNTCIYQGLPGGVVNNAGVSQACSASAETCRAYKGNAGNNIQNIFVDNFENGNSGWAGQATVSNVSTRVGEHSLEITGSAEKTITLETGKSYEISFWARGTGGNLSVSLVNSSNASTDLGSVSVGDVWQEYRLGPKDLQGSDPNVRVRVTSSGVSRVYFDNVRLVKVSDHLYLVKKTLKVDPICDSTPNDNLPGEALGCKSYTDPQNRKFHLTGFTNICRENAIGCTALFDTFNTIDNPKAEVYNVWLSGASGATVNANLGSDRYSCTVPNGQNGCYVNVFGHTPTEILSQIPGSLVASTIAVPADTATSTPIYLVANQTASCSQNDLGCTYAGVATKSPTGTISYVTTTIKNDPSRYGETLCEQEAVGCNAFRDGSDIRYFKDPKSVGQTMCVYRTNIRYNGSVVSGWFFKDRTEPCYPNYQPSSNVYGIWSYGNAGNYQNKVGECPSEQNRCTEFVDRADRNKAYYLIKDDKVSEGDCGGQVSQKAGCALFDQTDQPTKLWNTAATYALSNSSGGQPVNPDTSGTKDANIIMKVVQDRECGEWLECDNAYSTFDETANKFKTICQSLHRCGSGSEECAVVTSSHSGRQLDESFYRSRGVTWSDMEYSGYSLLNFYPIEELKEVNFASSSMPEDWRLAKKIPCNNVNCAPGFSSTDFACENHNAPCGVNGICKNRICVQSGNGENIQTAPKYVCRAFPENDSPFPGTVNILRSNGFEGAKVCDDLDPEACECDYRKVQFGELVTKYWGLDKFNTVNRIGLETETIPPELSGRGICVGGSRDGKLCRPVEDPAPSDACPSGVCEAYQGERTFLGWKGFCLERDTSRRINASEIDSPCLTWYPIDSLIGATDINNQHIEAGGDWRPSAFNGGYYCINSKGSSGEQSLNITFSPRGLRADDDGDAHFNDGYGNNYTGFWDCGPHGCGYKYDGSFFQRSHITVSTGAVDVNGAVIPGVSALQNLTKEDIDLIQFMAGPGTGGPNGMAASGPYYMVPNDVASGTPQSYYRLDNGGVLVGGFYRKDPNDIMIFYGSHGSDPATNPNGFDVNTGMFKQTEIHGTPIDPNGGGGGIFGGPKAYQSSPGLSGKLFDNQPLYAGDRAIDDIWAPSTVLTNGYSYNSRTVYNQQQNDPAGTDESGRSYWYDSSGNITYTPQYSQVEVGKEYVGGIGLCPAPVSEFVDKDGNHAKTTWHAIRFKFDSNTHKLTDIYTAHCNPAYILNYNYRNTNWNITFKLREWCSDIADASFDLTSGFSSPRTVFWTDRLWGLPAANPFRAPHSVPTLLYNYDTQLPAFGSVGLGPFPDTTPIAINQPPQLQCDLNTYIADATVQNPTPTNCDSLQNIIRPSSAGGVAYSYTGFGTSTVPVADPVRGRELHSTVFSGVFKNSVYNLGLRRYVTSSLKINYTEDGDPVTGQKPKPPQVRPLGQRITTLGSFTIPQYLELNQQGFTINEKNGGFVESGSSNFIAYLDFFGFADKNQMPIKSVIINWGDGRENSVRTGFMRNARGLLPTACSSGICVVSSTEFAPNTPALDSQGRQISCTTSCDPIHQCQALNLAKDYGLIASQTCDNQYFHFEKTYTCSLSMQLPRCVDENSVNCIAQASDNNLCGANGSVNFKDGCCIFQPKVQVKDNWGWCNGSCGSASSPGGTGCYDKSWAGQTNECIQSGAFTSFNGKVILKPN